MVHNTGELDIHNVFVIEDSFDGLIFDRTIRDDLWDYEIVDGRHKWTLKESLAGHEYAGIFVIFNTTATGNFTNYAIVGHEGQNKTVNATVEVNETVHAPDVINAKMNISIETIHPLVVVGDQTMFEIVVHNTGNVPLTQVTVEEFEYNGLIFHDFKVENELWDYIPKTLTQATRVGLLGAPVENDHTWIINTPLLVNEYLGFFVIFNSTATGRYTNTVHGSSDQTPDKLPASDDVHVIDTAYTIEKVAVTPEANVGDEVTFQIIVKNIGEVDITELAISENPDDGLEFVRDEGTEDMWSRDGMTWYLSNTLVSGETLQFFVVFKATKAGNLTNTIVSDDKTSNATVSVSEKVPVENQTNPDENETAPEDEGDSDGGEIIPSGEFYAQGSATTQDSTVAVNADVNSKATGNPIFALLAVLLSLVVLRRRN